MKKAGTAVPALGSACVVFGVLNRSKSPKAGLFDQNEARHAAKLAAKAGLMTVKVPGAAVPKLSNLVGTGRISLTSGLRLMAIEPTTLADLHARYRAQTADKLTGGSVPGSSKAAPAKPANGAPPPPAPSWPPSGSLDLGPSLLAAYRQLDAAGRWFEKAQAEISDVLTNVGASSGLSFLQEAETTDLDHYHAGDGWLLDGWRWTFPTRHRRSRIGDLSVVVDLGRAGRAAATLGMPCMLVMWSGAPHNWGTAVDTAMGFWPALRATTELHGDRVFKWAGKAIGNGPAGTLSPKDSAWFYLVRLAGLTNAATLRTHVVQPALALLAEKDVEAAFAEAPDVLRFRQHGKEFVLDQ